MLFTIKINWTVITVSVLTIIFLFFLFFSSKTNTGHGNANENIKNIESGKARETVLAFLAKMRKNESFSYTDGVRFFGTYQSPVNRAVLLKMGYGIEKKGYLSPSDAFIVKETPFSPLGELLRMYRHVFIMDVDKNETERVEISVGRPYVQFSGLGKPPVAHGEDTLLVACIITSAVGGIPNETFPGRMKVLTFTYSCKYDQLVFPITVDGESILPSFGFTYSKERFKVEMSDQLKMKLDEFLSVNWK